MVLQEEDTDIFERKCAIFVLLAIDKFPHMTKLDIMTLGNGKNEKTKYIRIKELIEAGMVKYEKEKGVKRLTLTPEGEVIAANLKKVRINYIRLRNKTENREIEKQD